MSDTDPNGTPEPEATDSPAPEGTDTPETTVAPAPDASPAPLPAAAAAATPGADVLDLTGMQTLGERLVEQPRKPYDPARARESARRTIALILVWLLVVIVGLSYFTMWATNVPNNELREILEL